MPVDPLDAEPTEAELKKAEFFYQNTCQDVGYSKWVIAYTTARSPKQQILRPFHSSLLKLHRQMEIQLERGQEHYDTHGANKSKNGMQAPKELKKNQLVLWRHIALRGGHENRAVSKSLRMWTRMNLQKAMWEWKGLKARSATRHHHMAII